MQFCALGLAVLAPLAYSQQAVSGKAIPPSLATFSDSLENLSARVRPSVVQIFSTGYAPPQEDQNGQRSAALLTTQTNTGSGVILTSDGYIVTNDHVVEGARKIEVKVQVRLTPERTQDITLPARVVGVDRETDLAVIKVARSGLPALELGDSDSLRQGELVLAFGNPLGLEGSVSMGVVSSTGRQIKLDDPMSYIQTDAPINPGNSGGPLVDTSGRVMGINAMILSQSGGSEGIGFAIPSKIVSNIFKQIRKTGHVRRGHIGMSVQSITPVLAKGLNLPQDWGVVVSDLEPDGPAAKAGVQIGDVVQDINGEYVETASQLENDIYRLTLEDVAHLTLRREAKTIQLDVSVHQRENDPERFADLVNSSDNLVPQLGILAIELTGKVRVMLPGLRHPYGLVVAVTAAGAPYSGGALHPGDVIYEVNNIPAISVKAIRAELGSFKPGAAVVLQVERSGQLMYIPLELE